MGDLGKQLRDLLRLRPAASRKVTGFTSQEIYDREINEIEVVSGLIQDAHNGKTIKTCAAWAYNPQKRKLTMRALTYRDTVLHVLEKSRQQGILPIKSVRAHPAPEWLIVEISD